MDKISILIVDDQPAFREGLRRILEEEEDFDIVDTAADGVEAVNLAKKLKPDVVIMDITMPRMDGLNALKAIKQIDPLARVIVCSALGQQKLIIDAIKMGAKDFIVKPFEPDRLSAAIQKALK